MNTECYPVYHDQNHRSCGSYLVFRKQCGNTGVGNQWRRHDNIEAFLPGLDQFIVDHSTEEWLDKIEDRLNYKDCFCGYWHIDKRVDKMHFMMRSVEAL